MKNNDLIIFYAIILQLITGIFVFLAQTPIEVARLGAFYLLFPSKTVGSIFIIIAAILAIHALFLRQKGKWWYFFFFFPQFFFLLLTTGSALNYVLLQHYADGIIRPWPFIFIDQLPSFIATTLYAFAIFDFRRKINVKN